MAKYRVWFNTKRLPPQGIANPLDLHRDGWCVQEKDMGLQTAPGVTIHTEISFVTGSPGSTPQGWAECEGQASRDGQTNFIVIRPL
jgi:hypothetical protein